MYLICLVGCVLIKSKAGSTKNILTELVEMTRGVQHPVRGLFVRSYLAQQSKDKLPDHVESGEDGSVEDAISFVIQNFTEMNKLWVRMQHQSMSEFASEDATGLEEFESVDAFNKLSASVSNILSSRQDLPVLDGVSLYVSLVKFAVNVYPEDVAYAKAVLDSAAAAYGGRGKITDRKAVSQVQVLLSTPLEQYEAVVLLSFTSYEQLLGCLEFPAKHTVAISTLKQMFKKNSKIANAQDVERVMTFLNPLIAGEEEEDEVALDEDFSEEQTMVSAIVHLIECPDPGHHRHIA
eukprot:jgi/Pico_ML_1/53939/g4396.t1